MRCARRICSSSNAGGQTSRAEYSGGISTLEGGCAGISEGLGRRVNSTDYAMISVKQAIIGEGFAPPRATSQSQAHVV